jgi:hypothetical protein
LGSSKGGLRLEELKVRRVEAEKLRARSTEAG